MNLGDEMPDFHAQCSHDGETQCPFHFHDYIGDSWAIMFSHPADYTPVCTTEIAKAQNMFEEFASRGVKMLALSCDSAEDHIGWICDVKRYTGNKFSFPVVSDLNRDIAIRYGMLDPREKDKKGMPVTARAVFIIKDKKLKLSLLYPATTGRNFDEILRVIDSLQLTDTKKVATPVNWKPGDEVMIVPSVTDEELATLFPGGTRSEALPSGKVYMRYTNDYKVKDVDGQKCHDCHE